MNSDNMNDTYIKSNFYFHVSVIKTSKISSNTLCATLKMFVFGCLFLVASVIAHPATETRPPIIDYEFPLGYYPAAPLLRTSIPLVIEEPKGEKQEEKAVIGEAPTLPPLNIPVIHEVVIENEPKKEIVEKPAENGEKPSESDKSSTEEPAKPEEKPILIKVDGIHPHIVRFSWPSWLPNIFDQLTDLPIVSNILSFANKPTTIFQPANYRIPVVLK
nr:uncharacterized protein LOC128670926 isoform X1 [Plodia interpunctella]